MSATALGINAAASAVFSALQDMFPDFRLASEGMPNFARQPRFVMIHKESVDAKALAKLARVHLGSRSSWLDIGNFLEKHVRTCLCDQARAFTLPSPLGDRIQIIAGVEPEDLEWIC